MYGVLTTGLGSTSRGYTPSYSVAGHPVDRLLESSQCKEEDRQKELVSLTFVDDGKLQRSQRCSVNHKLACSNWLPIFTYDRK
jgi:hypothetical protein